RSTRDWSSDVCSSDLLAQNPPAGLGARPRGAPIAPGDQSANQGTPAPRLPDGSVNLGRVPGEKGVWDLAANSNFARFSVDAPARSEERRVGKEVRYGR